MEQERKNEFMHFLKQTEKSCVSVVVSRNNCSVVIHNGNFIKSYILEKVEEEQKMELETKLIVENENSISAVEIKCGEIILKAPKVTIVQSEEIKKEQLERSRSNGNLDAKKIKTGNISASQI